MLIEVIEQLFLGVSFLILSVIIFTSPGRLVVGSLRYKFQGFLETYTVSTVLGICLFTFSAYLLAAVNLRFLIWIFPLAGFFGIWKLRRGIMNFGPIGIGQDLKKVFLIVLLIGVIGQLAVNAPSGLKYQDGIYFWSSHGHDGVWHISLMEEMHKDIFPFQNPEFAGHRLQNYHFFVDLLMSELTRMFPFSNLDVYFRFMPLLFSILLGLGSYIFVRAWSKSDLAGVWAMFFTYFAGSFGYLLSIPANHNLNGETIFWVSQTQSVLGNPPHASAFIILTVFLFLLVRFYQDNLKSLVPILIFLGGVIIEFKVYGGVLILGGLLVVGIWQIFKERKIISLALFILTTLFALVIYLPNSVNSQDFLIWQPWWFIRTMIVAGDRLNWIDLENRRQTYILQHNYKRVIELETIAFLAFLFGNLGMRFLGFWTWVGQFRNKTLFENFNIFFASITLASFLIPVFFVQKGVAWNAIQFNQYFLLLFGFLAAVSVSSLMARTRIKNLKFLIVFLIVLLSVPTQLGLLWQFYSNSPLSKVSFEELDGLNFLQKNSSQGDIILTPHYNEYAKNKYQPPVPISTWSDTGYVSAFTNLSTYLTDKDQLDIMGYNINQLIDERRKLFVDPNPAIHNSPDPKVFNNFIERNHIKYVYLVYDEQFAAPVDKLNLELVYHSNNVRIYKVR